MAFNFKQYTANNPLLQSLEEDGPDVTMGDMMAYGADQEVGEPMEEEVNYDKVNTAINDTLEAMRKSIKTHGLSNDDVYELRIKLAQFFA